MKRQGPALVQFVEGGQVDKHIRAVGVLRRLGCGLGDGRRYAQLLHGVGRHPQVVEEAAHGVADVPLCLVLPRQIERERVSHFHPFDLVIRHACVGREDVLPHFGQQPVLRQRALIPVVVGRGVHGEPAVQPRLADQQRAIQHFGPVLSPHGMDIGDGGRVLVVLIAVCPAPGMGDQDIASEHVDEVGVVERAGERQCPVPAQALWREAHVPVGDEQAVTAHNVF